jgi:hypothetical protein
MKIETKNRPRFSPIRNLTPERLTQMLDAFEQGYLAEAALTWDTIEKRDDTIKSVSPKRKKAIARHGWEVIVLPNLPCEQQPEALRHKEALEYFYTNLRCSHALDGNERGGFKLLVRQMMDAVGKRYAVHEVVWRVENKAEGRGMTDERGMRDEARVTNSSLNLHPSSFEFRVTAELRFVPLWFFENTTGELRLTKAPYYFGQGNSEALRPGAWMITAGEGLMTACSIAWMYKNLPLQDWLDFSHRYGHPALVAATTAARNSTEWIELERVMEDFLSQLSAMTTAGEQIKLVDLKGGGELPYERLISRMDRLITALWRGADLSTLSREQGYGASLQAGESDILEQDDAEMISETLQTYLDRYVIEYLFGKGVRPLAAVTMLLETLHPLVAGLGTDPILAAQRAKVVASQTLSSQTPLSGSSRLSPSTASTPFSKTCQRSVTYVLNLMCYPCIEPGPAEGRKSPGFDSRTSFLKRRRRCQPIHPSPLNLHPFLCRWRMRYSRCRPCCGRGTSGYRRCICSLRIHGRSGDRNRTGLKMRSALCATRSSGWRTAALRLCWTTR